MAPFRRSQIDEYVDAFAKNPAFNQELWTADQFKASLKANADLSALASSPLMLYMVLTILPAMSNAQKVSPVTPPCRGFICVLRCADNWRRWR